MKSPRPLLRTVDFDKSPFIVIWETTRACALKCVHCRAEAINKRNPDELTTKEAFSLLDEIRLFGKPLVVLTGGDPLRRPDVKDIVGYGTRIGLRMAITPSGTDEVTQKDLKDLKKEGLARLAVSLDGSDSKIHDSFRGVDGSFDWTLDIIRWANELNLPVQINTTITRHNLNDMDAMADLLGEFKIALWSVFFLVPMGRARIAQQISADEHEQVFHKMVDIALSASFDVKSTEAPQYRRVVLQRKKETDEFSINGTSEGSFTWINSSKQNDLKRAIKGVNDGKGFLFISHRGEIFPSGFLPISAGNVRRNSLVNVYRNSDLFKTLRDYSKLKGKCGICEYKAICGGSRSRAFAVHGDMMQSDPSCSYMPKY